MRALEGTESISLPFDFWLDVISTDPDGVDDGLVCGARATITFKSGDEVVRRVHGVIAAMQDELDTEAAWRAYRMRVVPRVHWLDLVRKQEIFLDRSVSDIVQSKLEAAGMTIGVDFELRLAETYAPRDFVTQYKESDLDFANRITEHLGISYHFEDAGDQERIVFSDHIGGFTAAQAEIPFRPRGEGASVYSIKRNLELRPEHFFVTDFNYRTPSVDLTGKAKMNGIAVAGGVVEYGSHTKSPEEAAHLAKVRSQAADCERCRFTGESSLAAMTAGLRFELDGHKLLDERELLCVEVKHRVRHAVFGELEAEPYSNAFVAVPASADYRPPLRTPRPRIYGVVNAIVMGSDEQPDKPQIDDHGRYFVRFAFDVEGPSNGSKSSRPIRMATPHSGASYGMHFPLKPGVEVLVVFVDGDPDRPIIVSAVPNPSTPSPVTEKNRMVNKLKTASGCVLEFFDGD